MGPGRDSSEQGSSIWVMELEFGGAKIQTWHVGQFSSFISKDFVLNLLGLNLLKLSDPISILNKS